MSAVPASTAPLFETEAFPAEQAFPGPREYRVGELFAGAGGMALGASKASIRQDGLRHGFSHVWAVDNNRDACNTLDASGLLPPGGVICSRVEDVDYSTLAPIDGLAFGFPCNDFSVVGEHNGINGKFGGLYLWAAKALRHFQPLFFVAENVSGIASSGQRRDFLTILDAFEAEGYDVKYRKYRFEEYGVPQARHRIIIVGFRHDLEMDPLVPKKVRKVKTCREAIEQPPIGKHVKNNELTAQHPRVVERLKHILPGQNVFTAPNMPEHLRLKLKSGATMSQIYRRLDPDRPSYTITGSGGGGTHGYHWKENRALTNRERARLQTFPDSFVFLGSKESVRKQIGMAVPPEGAKVVFRSVLKSLLSRDAG